jgi:hypothetical protein
VTSEVHATRSLNLAMFDPMLSNTQHYPHGHSVGKTICAKYSE